MAEGLLGATSVVVPVSEASVGEDLPDWLPQMVRVPGGRFMMGARDLPWAQPVHEVTVQSFEIAETESTVAQYRHCVAAGACEVPDIGSACTYTESPGTAVEERRPVNCVSREDARAFADFVAT